MLLSIAVDHQTHFIPESLFEAKRAVWQFLDVNLPAPSTTEHTQTVIESATEVNFKSFVFTALLRQLEKEIFESVQEAIEIAQFDEPQRIDEFIEKLNFSRMAQQAFVSKRNIEEAILSINSFGQVAKHYTTIDAMLGAMNSIDRLQRKKKNESSQIQLSTIEDAKGLEFNYVFIPDCNSNIFDGPSQDERNLFYVAASRARKHLMFSYKKGDESSYLKYFM